ncbi:MAG: DUF4270 domain-containing protein [Bacteroidaceae bacterium]|nr:DUF4270 domain-containing protein [Bacteroidaceae bacterium]
MLKQNLRHLLTLAAALLMLASCDDDTATLGVDMMPTTDLITTDYQVYKVKTSSYEAGSSVLARTTKSYLGRFTDPETGTTIKNDFMVQFHCDEEFSMPDIIEKDSCISIDLRLIIDDFVGDSLATFKISAYELNKQLDPNADYYTDINPADYYDTEAEPLAVKWFTLNDRTITDSARWASGHINNIRVNLPNELGTKIIRDYREHPKHFTNTPTWLNSGNPCSKGVYFKLESGDGAMAYIDIVQMNIQFTYFDEGYQKDTLGMASLAATDAVVEATRFENSNLEKLLNDTKSTYLKTPAGIFTLATLPADQINVKDTINSAKLTFTRYNDKVDSNFKLAIPTSVLMVRLDDYLNGFFENYNVNDSKESYLATFNSNNNTYVFNNIARLLTIMAREKAGGKATENWNKVLLIPVEATKDSNGNIVKLNHDFSMSSARLVGGDDDELDLEVIYSNFK